MSLSPSGNKPHDATVAAAELTRQNAMAGVSTQSAAVSVTTTYYRAILASKIANNLDAGNEIIALKNLGATV